MGTRTVSQTISLQSPDQTSKYITPFTTEIGGNGITIHPANQIAESNYIQIDNNSLDIKQGTDVLATFGENNTQIGLNGESHLNLDYHSMQLIDRDGYTYFYVSDLLDRDGNITEERLREPIIPDIHNEVSVDVDFDISAIVEVLADDVDVTSDTTFNQKKVTITNVTEAISNLVITYTPDFPSPWYYASYFKAYTIGVRNARRGQLGGMSTVIGYSNAATGFASLAEGEGTIASGDHSHAEGGWTQASGSNSHAQNVLTIAGYDNQTAIGKCNDNKSVNAFEIGNGTSDSERSNALTVDWDGDVEMALDTSSTSGTDKEIYDALVSLGWDGDVIV